MLKQLTPVCDVVMLFSKDARLRIHQTLVGKLKGFWSIISETLLQKGKLQRQQGICITIK